MRFWSNAKHFRKPIASWLRRAVRFHKNEQGVAALEFALLGPIVIFSFLAMADVGLAVRDRMALDHIVRTGAQKAAENTGAASVFMALQAASAGSLTRSTSAAALTVSVDLECTCPEAPAVTVACTTTCSGQKPTFIFYSLRAETVASGILLADMPLASRARVQVR